MDQLDELEFSLEDILLEFGEDDPTIDLPVMETIPGYYEDELGDTIRLDKIQDVAATPLTVSEDTQVFASINPAQSEEPVSSDTMVFSKETMEQTIVAEPFAEEIQQEAEPETPVSGPIAFQDKEKLRQLRHKIVSGPEQRYYELLEKGTGKMQMAALVCFLVFAVTAVTTIVHACGLVPAERIRLFTFIQFLGVLICALMGYSRMVDGFAAMTHLRFTTNSLLLFTFIACVIDGVLCLKEQRLSIGTVFCLEMTMALLAQWYRRGTELRQMDTMRRANNLNAVVCAEDYYEGKQGYCTAQGDVEDFMDHYREISGPEKVLNWYAFSVLMIGIVVGVAAIVLHGFAAGMQMCVGTLLLGLPASACVCLIRPAALLENRLNKHGTVLCGWKGMRVVRRKGVFPVEDQDLFPDGAVRLNGVKFYGGSNPDQVIAFAAALAKAGGGAQVSLFSQMLESRKGFYHKVDEFKRYTGGIGGIIGDRNVLMGSVRFMREMGVDVSKKIHISHAVCISVDGELCGIFALNYHKHKATAAGIQTLCSYHGLVPMVMTEDFMITARFVSETFQVNTRHAIFPDRETFLPLLQRKPQETDTVVALTTRPGLASKAFAITGARVQKSAMQCGLVVHMIGGIMGLIVMGILAVLGATGIVTPVNVLLFELLWVVPGLLITEWTRSV